MMKALKKNLSGQFDRIFHRNSDSQKWPQLKNVNKKWVKIF